MNLLKRSISILLFSLLAGCGSRATVDLPAPKSSETKTAAKSTEAKVIEPKVEETKTAEPKAVVPNKEDRKKPAEPWGTLKGRIVWGGAELPKRGEVNIGPHPEKAFCTKDGVPLEDNTFIVDPKSRGLRNVFLWLDIKEKALIHPSLASPAKPTVTIDQPVCMFIPHALAVREGQMLEIKNSTPASLHNFKYQGHPEVNPGGNQTIGPGQSIMIKDLRADRFPISVECNVHTWMKGWIRVFDHPYYAVTDSQGNFEIKLAPAGSYRLMIWHSEGWLGGKKGREGRPVEIPNGGLDLGAIEFPPPG